MKIFFRLLMIASAGFLLEGAALQAQCLSGTPTASLTGNTCANSILTVQSNMPIQTINWIRDGQTIATAQSAPANGVTVAGNANGYSGNTPALLSHPDRIIVDDAGNLYVPDMNNNRVQKWPPGATEGITVAGGNGKGVGMNQLDRPTSVALDAQGNLYITDQNNNRIQKWAPGATTGTTFSGDIKMPTDIYIDQQGNVYASAQQMKLVLKWAAGSTTPVTVADGSAFMAAATGIHVDQQGAIYVCDADNHRVLKFANGPTSYQVVAGTGIAGLGASQLFIPLDVFVDCAGNMYIADYYNARVQKWAPGATAGVTVGGTDGYGTGPNQLDWCIGVTLDKDNNLYISDAENDRVQKISNTIVKTFTAVDPGVYQAEVITGAGTVLTQPITITALKYPAITISSDVTSTCQGLPVSFTASATDGGSQPVYQWMKNGQPVGTNTPAYTASDFADGDIITCILRSSETCIDQPTATSNSITLRVATSGNIKIEDDFGICPTQQITFTAPPGYASYEWQDGSTGLSLTTADAGLYWIRVTDACGQTFADSMNVFIHPVSRNFLPADFSICSYDKIDLGSRVNFVSYSWNTGQSTSNITINSPGTYSLEGIDANNCVSRDTVIVTSKQCPPMGIYVPKAFTPDHNGLNDVFKPVVAGQLKHYEFAVYNRYGQEVFRSKDPSKGWDGNLKGARQDSNVFVWQCSYQLDGQEKKIDKGTVLLIR